MPFGSALANSERAVKCPRERFLLVCAETVCCPDVLNQFLRLLGSECPLPADIVVERGARLQWVGVLFDPQAYRPSERLIGRLEQMPSVWQVAVIDDDTRSLFAPDGAVGQGFVAIAFLLEETKRAQRRRLTRQASNGHGFSEHKGPAGAGLRQPIWVRRPTGR